MKIGELARRAGTTTKTIRYYEDIGLLPEADRSPNGYRNYDEASLDRLSFIRDSQATGLTLDEIASIIELRAEGESTCDHVIDLLGRHLTAVDAQITALRRTRTRLVDLLDRARALDTGDCVDPIRCQTIATPEAAPPARRTTAAHLHTTPTGHRH